MESSGDARKLFLNVARSLSGKKWLDRLDDAGRRTAAAIAEYQGIGELAGRVIAARGIGVEEAQSYLNPTLRDLMPDPSTMQGMDDAAARFLRAIEAGETIGIFGDYDVDGACSSALLHLYLADLGIESLIHIPDRIGEGYGPNIPAIDDLKARGIDLLVTVDCGTVSHEPLAHAQSIGLDTIVLDHHQTGPDLPVACAIVNPNRQDDISGLGHLCAAGVTFMALVALNRALKDSGYFEKNGRNAPDLMMLIDLVALATVCDVVPLKGLNRAFVGRGLEVLNKGANTGLKALCEVARVSGPVAPYHLGFVLGPRINAGGRVGNAALGAQLLSTADEQKAYRIAAELDALNQDRQVIEKAAVEEAIAEASAESGDTAPTLIVTSSDTWHPGVVGLVASRLKDRFNRPSIAIAFDGDTGTGSARSISGVDLGAAVRAAVDAGVLEKGGGHEMAAGLTVKRENLAALRAFLSEKMLEDVSANAEERIQIDGALSAGAATLDLMREIARAEPFGAGNPAPVVVFPSHRLAFAEATPQGHIRLRITGQGGATVSGIAFRAVGTELGDALLGMRGQNLHFAGTLHIDRWRGRETVSLHLRDAALIGQ